MSTLALLQLSTKLSIDSDVIIQVVRLAIDNPNRYFEEHSEQLNERNIDEHSEELPWIALVDELIENGLAYEIDWKEASQDICEIIDYLLERNNFPPLDWKWLDEVQYEELLTEQVLNEVSQKLKERCITLAYLDVDSDSYVLITVADKEIEGLKRLAIEAGKRISDIFI
ncbi:DUF6630 family protein [Paenibacillus glacialis]|uniref:DUF6630 domain-containing protein n=1 Tax=Paenibacillus glacialis TaxID=494026 RepID=A0A168N8N3_9BACL|nr:DUF6630 family protein [Paenibacillus glacialis]OAB45522.1 hypothetical protein PGLA_04535 [Paenibacillus glacialis]